MVASSVIQKLFQLPVLAHDENEVKNLELTHYCINLGESPIVSVVRENVGLKLLPRGIIFPVYKWGKYEVDSNYDDNPELTKNARGEVWRIAQPGHIARFLERDYGELGLKALWGIVGYPEREIMQAAEVFNFSEAEWQDENLKMEMVFEMAAKSEWQWNNQQIKNAIADIRFQWKKEKVIIAIANDLEAIVNNVDAIQRQSLYTAKNAITKEQLPCLDPRHHLMCKATGLSAADFEVSGDAARIASQNMFVGLGDMFKENLRALKEANASTNAPVMAAAPDPRMDEMFTFMKQQSAAMEKLQEENSNFKKDNLSLKNRLDYLEKQNAKPKVT